MGPTILERRMIERVRSLALDPALFVEWLADAVEAADDFAAAQREFRSALLSFCTGESDKNALEDAGQCRLRAQVRASGALLLLTGRGSIPAGGGTTLDLPEREE